MIENCIKKTSFLVETPHVFGLKHSCQVATCKGLSAFLRHCVIDRKITQGTRGEAGERYHERMWKAIATCKKQSRSFFVFLLEAISANLNRQAAPTLLEV